MTKSEDMQAAIIEVTIQAATIVVRAVREVDQLAESHTRRSSQKEHHRPKQAGPMLSQPMPDWKAPDRYVEVLNFEMEVAKYTPGKSIWSQ